MASLIPGYEYDIFISYRQKDNKHDGWVTDFVDNLKGELEATFKEEISVYFDINPHDGLLETHDVDASLKEKLKCLIFIPIISRTYCDPKSFAWEHEFKAFVEMASKDQFGLKVRLPNGNIASRVLPVRIHDLDTADVDECESVLGGVLRGIEFIYKEPGADKPLSPDDDDKKNLNNTKYRIQIVKVAHAIKEVILGMKIEPSKMIKEKVRHDGSFEKVREEKQNKVLEKFTKRPNLKLLRGITIFAILIIVAVLAFAKILRRDTLEKLKSSGGRISVAVMPFQNATNDTALNFCSYLIQGTLINYLSNYSDYLFVRLPESMNSIIQPGRLMNYNLLTISDASIISRKLNADVFIYGNIYKAGDLLRINTQLINSRTKEVYKNFPMEIFSIKGMNFHVFDSLSILVKDYLILKQMQIEEVHNIHHVISTGSPEAYEKYILGCDAFNVLDYANAVKYFEQAISIDTNFIDALYKISTTYSNQGLYDQAKKWCLKAYSKRDQMSSLQQIQIDYLHARYFDTPYERIKYLRQILNIDNQSSLAYYNLGVIYNNLFQYEKAIPEFEKTIKLNEMWGIKPGYVNNYTLLGYAYHMTGQFKKEKKIYKEAGQYFKDNPNLIFRQAVLSLSSGEMKEASDYIEKYSNIQRGNSVSEASIADDLANIYLQGELLDKAEDYFKKALSLDPDNPDRMNNLAWFLIDKDRDISKGLELVNKALELSPDNYYYLDCKGWGLYKQGKYKDALGLLNKSWQLKPIYRHTIFLHLEAAKKAVAGQNKNN